MRRYPLAALAAAAGMTEAQLGRAVGLSGSTLKKAREWGLTEPAAERYAHRAHLMAHEVWPEIIEHRIADASQECAAPDCTETFIPPIQGRQRYCSNRCRSRTNGRKAYQSDEATRAAKKARSAAYRAANPRAVKVKNRVYYQANADDWRRRREARVEEAA